MEKKNTNEFVRGEGSPIKETRHTMANKAWVPGPIEREELARANRIDREVEFRFSVERGRKYHF